MLSDEQRRVALSALRGDGSIADLAAAGAGTAEEIRANLRSYLREKADLGPAEVQTKLKGSAGIVRDRRGVPHITADDPDDLFVALGYAQAQDRLWQLDYLRRHAYGRLSQVYGRETLESDVLSRTLDIGQIAEGVTKRLGPDSGRAVEAFAAGVNLWLEQLPAGLPPEFEILGYAPEPWRPVDCIAIQRRWWWYLTGRLNVLSTPEAVRAGIGDGPLYDAFFQPDGPVAYIVPPGSYDPSSPWTGQPGTPATEFLGGPMEPGGSNNWAAAPSIARDGAALLGSDPHVYFTVPADWYEFHLHGAGYDAAGAAYPATPGLLFGRNRHVAWGVTNNICSLRDLYVEELDPSDASRYRQDGAWHPIVERVDEISVKGEQVHTHTTRYAGNRPIVDHLLPERALPRHLWREDGFRHSALSLAWIGFEMGDETQCLLDLNRAEMVDRARETLRTWRCPTLNFVLADDAGSIGYQCAGAIPLRGRPHRGYRRPDEPRDAWQGTIPFDGLPRLHNPDRGWVATANNPTAPPDFPYPLAGTWAPEDRAPRAEHLLVTRQPHDLDGFAAMQTDVHSGRAERGVPGLLRAIGEPADALTRDAIDFLRTWDARLTPQSPAGAIFDVFYWQWHQRVVRERFAANLIPLVQDSGWGLSSALLHEDPLGWFPDHAARITALREAFREALTWLQNRLGSPPSTWTWGALHRLGAKHPVARTDLQHEIFDMPSRPHQGGASSLASAFYLPPGTFETRLGASYRLLASLGSDRATRAICWPGQSGQPGSPHYADQVDPYHADQHATVPFTWLDVEAEAESRTRLLEDRR
jgi:penicillin G amidase